MQAIADHVYHILIIAFVAATIVEAIVKFGVIGHYVLLEG